MYKQTMLLEIVEDANVIKSMIIKGKTVKIRSEDIEMNECGLSNK